MKKIPYLGKDQIRQKRYPLFALICSDLSLALKNHPFLRILGHTCYHISSKWFPRQPRVIKSYKKFAADAAIRQGSKFSANSES